MKKTLAVSAVAVLALVAAVPAFAGGAHCSGGDKASAATADAHGSCGAAATAWSGAWLQRSESGKLTIAEVAKGSPAARSGLRAGDVVLAVNGYDLSSSEARAQCASKADCKVGRSVSYTVQRGSRTKTIKFKLEKMPTNVSDRLASRQASFDPAVAAVVMPAIN